jgi:hypothetical protein
MVALRPGSGETGSATVNAKALKATRDQDKADLAAAKKAVANKKKKTPKKDPIPKPGPKPGPKKKPKKTAEPKVVVSSSVNSSSVPSVDPNVKDLYIKETQRLIASLINSSKDLLLSYNFSSIKSMPSFYLDLDREARSSAVLSSRAFPIELTRSFSEILLQDRITYILNQILPLIGNDVPDSTKFQTDSTKTPYYEATFDNKDSYYDLSLTLNALDFDQFDVKLYKIKDNEGGSLTAPPSISVEYLVVGGGGGGSNGTPSVNYGSGGAGGIVSTGQLSVSTSCPVTIGSGGAGAIGTSSAGTSSIFSSIVSPGGNGTNTGATGGSNNYYVGGTGVTVAPFTGGGGAGAGGNGLSKNGGIGISSSITGTLIGYGGGGSSADTTPGTAVDGGGIGSLTTGGGAAVANKGGGGGGGASTALGGNGGSGVVILKYPEAYTITIGSGLTGTTSAPLNGYKITTITAGTGFVTF